MDRFRISIDGTTPLLMHNSRLSDPLDPVAKALKRISGKRQKTDEDYLEMARIEHAGGLYHDTELGPYIPGENLTACLVKAARLSSRGPKIEQGVFIETMRAPLVYEGKRDVDGLWADENFRHRASVKVGQQRVMRTRPYFRQWECWADGIYDSSVINLADLAEIAVTAGARIGLGDWRPRYGRFTSTVEKAA